MFWECDNLMYGLKRYNSIEKDFIDADFYVSLTQNSVFSEFFTREIILLGAEIDSALKELCKRTNGSTLKNMGEYRPKVIEYLPNITKIPVSNRENGMLYYPFENFDKCKPKWWDVYTSLKHNIVDENATLGIALEMLQAYLLLIFCIEALNGNVNIDYQHYPKLFNVEFPIRGSTIIPSMDYVIIYSRDDILNSLGYISR